MSPDLDSSGNAENAPRPWAAMGDDWTIAWAPKVPYVSGSGPSSSTVIAALEAELDRAATIRLTPTSAAVESTTREPAAVLAALARCGRPFTLTGLPPSFESVADRVY